MKRWGNLHQYTKWIRFLGTHFYYTQWRLPSHPVTQRYKREENGTTSALTCNCTFTGSVFITPCDSGLHRLSTGRENPLVLHLQITRFKDSTILNNGDISDRVGFTMLKLRGPYPNRNSLTCHCWSLVFASSHQGTLSLKGKWMNFVCELVQ